MVDRNPFARWIANLARRRTIKRYLTIPPGRLAEDYGHRGPFTPEQVRATLHRYRISSARHAAYAIAIFCDEDGLKQAREAYDRMADYGALRREISADFFQGATGFSLRDVMGYAEGHGGYGEVGGAEGHSGAQHHDGGGFGHH